MSLTSEPKFGLVFDIETKRNPELRKALGIDEKIARLEGRDVEELRAIAVANDIALGNYKKPEVILKKVTDHFRGLAEKAALKQFGAVICSIACKEIHGADEDLKHIQEGGRLSEREGYHAPQVWTCNEKHSEVDIIRAFMRYLSSFREPVVLMGFNIRGGGPGRKGFDIPMLRARCAVHGINWPFWLPSNPGHDRRSDYLFDICDVFTDGTCDQWLRLCGLPVKTAHGQNVQDMSPDDIAAYNANDVELERLLCAMTLPTQPPRLANLIYD